jgi:hypothetical protein
MLELGDFGLVGVPIGATEGEESGSVLIEVSAARTSARLKACHVFRIRSYVVSGTGAKSRDGRTLRRIARS